MQLFNLTLLYFFNILLPNFEKLLQQTLSKGYSTDWNNPYNQMP